MISNRFFKISGLMACSAALHLGAFLIGVKFYMNIEPATVRDENVFMVEAVTVATKTISDSFNNDTNNAKNNKQKKNKPPKEKMELQQPTLVATSTLSPVAGKAQTPPTYPNQQPAEISSLSATKNQSDIVSINTGKSVDRNSSKLSAVYGNKNSALSELLTIGTPGAASFTYKKEPVYPSLARKMGKEGRVLFKLTIDEKGHLQKIDVLEPSGFGFLEAAKEAILKSKFAPATSGGKGIASQVLAPVRFALSNSGV